MRPLLHKEVQVLTGLLTTLVETLHLYNDQKPEVNRSLVSLLDVTAATYKQRGRADRESQTTSMKAELITALRGVNPVTLEKPPLRRNEMQSTIVFKVLQTLESLLRTDLQQAMSLLQRARELVNQIIVAAIQKGLIDDETIRVTTTQEAIESLWRAIAADPAIALAQKQLLLLVSLFDVDVLIDQVLSDLREGRS